MRKIIPPHVTRVFEADVQKILCGNFKRKLAENLKLSAIFQENISASLNFNGIQFFLQNNLKSKSKKKNLVQIERT